MSYDTTILADTPLLYYKHEEASGTTATDASGNGYDGSYPGSGVTYEADGPLEGETSVGVTFDGAAGRFTSDTLTGDDRPTYPFTIEGWVKPGSATPTAGETLLWLFADDLSEVVSLTVGAGNQWRLLVADQFDNSTITAGDITGDWQYVAAVMVSQTERRLYVDGSLVGTATDSITWGGTATNYSIIACWDGNTNFFPASISRTALYDAGLSAARIAEHYRAGILNALTLPMVTAKNMLAASYTWQAEVGAATAEAAKAYVEFIGMAPPASAAWLDTTPRAYTWLPNDDPAQWSSIGQGTGPALFPSARSIGITLYRKTPAGDADTLDDASVGFLSWVGAIIDDLKTAINAGGTGVLLADSIRIVQWYRASTKRKNTEGDHHRVDILIDWYGGLAQ